MAERVRARPHRRECRQEEPPPPPPTTPVADTRAARELLRRLHEELDGVRDEEE